MTHENLRIISLYENVDRPVFVNFFELFKALKQQKEQQHQCKHFKI